MEMGSPTDYIVVGISALTLFILLCGTIAFFTVRQVPKIRTNQVHLFITQTVASISFLISLMVSLHLLKFGHGHSWQSCYLWTVWLEGPCGFGLLVSCRIADAYRLYYFFVKRRLPKIKPYPLIPLLLLPWIGLAACAQAKSPFVHSCHVRNYWIIPLALLHVFYILILMGITWKIRSIEFKFDEFKELVKVVTVMLIFVGVWVAIYITNEVHHEETTLFVVASRFTLMLTANIVVLSFFFISMSRPLFSQLSMRKRKSDSMGQVLGVPDSEFLFPRGVPLNLDERIENLLQCKIFRQSFMAFADSRMAGESVHFYDEVHELNKIPIADTARRIYLTGHIIEQYIAVDSPMEINISHQMREDILNTTDLAHPDLFKLAVNEMVHIMRMNLEKDYRCSPFYLQIKEVKAEVEASDIFENISLDCSRKMSSVHGDDDPFHQDCLRKVSERSYQSSMQNDKESAENTELQSLQTNLSV